LDEKQRFTVNEAAQYLRRAASTTWLLIGRGQIRVIREGGRVFVPGSEIARLSRLPGEQGSAPNAAG
jgi:hypothetical protein